MKKLFQKLISDCQIDMLDNHVDIQDKKYYLFLMGTCVNFVQKPTIGNDKSYIRGETFSYLAQLTALLRGEKATIYKNATDARGENYAHAYASPSVDVVNGADTPGYEIGDRLAKAKILALAAIGRGKTHLTVSGFSRGGVESIMLMYELNRFRQLLADDIKKPAEKQKTLADLLCDTDSVPTNLLGSIHPSYTKQALKELTSEYKKLDDEQAVKKRLLDNLSQLEVDLFVLDPVPGGNFAKVIRLGWQEEAFYELPEFVKKRQAIIQEHETSNCFRCIVSKDMPYEVVPGCHGTGDGNQFDHNSKPVPENIKKRDLSGVQNLVIRRWIDFVGASLEDAEIEDAEIDLKHEELDAIAKEYLMAKPEKRDEILLENYKHILDNHEAFEYLNGQNYTGLGRHNNVRQVNYHRHSEVPITQLNAHGDKKLFLNVQHIEKWMQKYVKDFNFEEKSLYERTEWLKANLALNFPTTAEAKKHEHVSSGNLVENPDLLRTLSEKTGNHPMIVESMSYLVGMMMQQYLRNHLKDEERDVIREGVQSSVVLLQQASKESIPEAMRNLAGKILAQTQQDLTASLITHYHSKLEKYRQLIISSLLADSITDGFTWLVEAQSLLADFSILPNQIERLKAFCDQEKISTGLLGEPALQINMRVTALKSYAAKIMAQLPAVLKEKPKELEQDFYDEIRKLSIHYGAFDPEKIEMRQIHEKKRLQLEEGVNSLTLKCKKLENDLSIELAEKESLGQAVAELEAKNEEMCLQMEPFAKQKEELDSKVKVLNGENHQLNEDLLKQKEKNQELTKAVDDKNEENRLLTECFAKQKDALEQRVVELREENSHLKEGLSKQKKENQTLTGVVADKAKEIKQKDEDFAKQGQQLQSKTTDASDKNECIKAWQSVEEQNKLAIVFELQKRVNQYSDHLANVLKKWPNDKKAQEKHKALQEMKRGLDQADVLPSQRLNAFDLQLKNTAEQLKDHRDPMWMRFFRDCLRMLALAVSGVAIYRAVTGQPVNFFKPSRGEEFVDDANRISTALSS